MRKATFFVAGLLAAFLPLTLTAQQQSNASGQQIGSRTITTAVPFLMVAPDSRSGGMGEVGVAIADDANAMHWNPAALSFIDNRFGFAMSYSPWLSNLVPDINLAYLSGYYNTGTSGVIGASLRYFSLGTINLTNEIGDPVGEENPNEFALDVGYSLKISPSLSGAISLRYIYSRLNSNGQLNGNLSPINAVAGDVAFYYTKDFTIRGQSNTPVQFTSGINISNIGPKVSYSPGTGNRDFIPTNLRLGYAFKFFIDEYNSVTFTNDFNKLLVPSVQLDSTGTTQIGGGGRSDLPLLDGLFGSFADSQEGLGGELAETNVSVGLEYWYRELFAVRGGFFYEGPQYGNRRFINLGAGVRYNVFAFHFAYLVPLGQQHPLANTLRFTLSYDFEPAGTK